MGGRTSLSQFEMAKTVFVHLGYDTSSTILQANRRKVYPVAPYRVH